MIGASSEDVDSPLNVKIFDKSTGKWFVPTILGKKPKASKFHSAVLVTDDRILILTGDSSANEFAYFLEVFSSLHRIDFGTIGLVPVKFVMLGNLVMEL